MIEEILPKIFNDFLKDSNTDDIEIEETIEKVVVHKRNNIDTKIEKTIEKTLDEIIQIINNNIPSWFFEKEVRNLTSYSFILKVTSRFYGPNLKGVDVKNCSELLRISNKETKISAQKIHILITNCINMNISAHGTTHDLPYKDFINTHLRKKCICEKEDCFCIHRSMDTAIAFFAKNFDSSNFKKTQRDIKSYFIKN